MLDTSTNKGGELATNRSQLLQRLLSAGESLPAFMQDMLATQLQVVAGTEAAGFVIERAGESFTLRAVAHLRPDEASTEVRAAAIAAFGNLIKPCVQQNRDGAMEIAGADAHGEPQYCLVTLLRSQGQVVAASAVITRCLNGERAKQRLVSMELVAGYFDLYTLRRATQQTQQIAQSHQHVLQLAQAVATAEGFESAAMNLCNELATRAGASRVSLGWLKHEQVRIRALSHTEKFDKRQELVTDLQKVMEECLDQEEIVQFDPSSQEASPNVTRCARQFSQQQGGETILSLPLKRGAEIVGVVTLEFAAGQKITPNAAAGLAIAVDLLAPQLWDRQQNDRWLIQKTGDSIRYTAELAVGKKHMLAKTIIALSLALVIFIVLYKPVYRVAAPFQFVPVHPSTVSAPFDGYVWELAKVDQSFVQPGVSVVAGQVLMTLDSTELRNKLAEALTRANALQKQADDHRSKGKTAEAVIALEDRKAALEEANLYQTQIDRTVIRAPIDGEILRGDWRDKQNKSPVKRGEVLFEIANRQDLRAELSVSERDVQELKVGQDGQLATTSLPTEKKPFVVQRIVPQGEAKDNDNVFRVWVDLKETNPDWRPGMMGEARVEVGQRRVAWIWTHRLVDFLRLKLWM